MNYKRLIQLSNSKYEKSVTKVLHLNKMACQLQSKRGRQIYAIKVAPNV